MGKSQMTLLLTESKHCDCRTCLGTVCALCGHDGCLHIQWAASQEKNAELGILSVITKQYVDCSLL